MMIMNFKIIVILGFLHKIYWTSCHPLNMQFKINLNTKVWSQSNYVPEHDMIMTRTKSASIYLHLVDSYWVELLSFENKNFTIKIVVYQSSLLVTRGWIVCYKCWYLTTGVIDYTMVCNVYQLSESYSGSYR